MSTLSKTNVGGLLETSLPTQKPGLEGTQSRMNVVLVERMLLELLRGELDRFADTTKADKFRAFMREFFDPVVGEEERESFITNFQTSPPEVVLNYPRTATSLPCIAVVLEGESETDDYLADEVGETLEKESVQNAARYVGSHWESTYALHVYAEHPDVCAYLYQIMKMIVFGAKSALEGGGYFKLRLSGTEIQPDPSLVPENVFIRSLRVTGTSLLTVPVYRPDPARFRVRVFMDDVIVDGLRGGVTGYLGDE